MTTRATLARLDARWADEYGVTPGFWFSERIDVAPRAGEPGYRGLFVFRRGDACLVQVPPGWGERTARWIAGRSPEVLLDPGYWAGALGARLARTIGPAWLGYADAEDFADPGTDGARRLGPADAEALHRLEAAVGPTAWEHGGIAHGHEPIYGAFADGELAAASAVETWAGGLGHVGVVSAPARRGRGLATSAAALAVREGLAQGLVMQWRTLAANAPSLGIARKLGFRPYATTLAVRLAEDDSR